MLGSNNYLGLTTHPKVREAAKAAIDKYGTSMTGSRLVNGTMKLHKELEDKLAAYHGKEAGLVFTTGYQVNIATISALLSNKKSVAVIDKDDHASIYDGVRLAQAAGARMVRYKHNDPAALDQALSRARGRARAPWSCTDGVFSAQGEIANLPGIVEVVKKHKARILVDDAHALGVIGAGRPRHRGALRPRRRGRPHRRHLLQVAGVHRRLARRRPQGARLRPALRLQLPLRGERRARPASPPPWRRSR